MKDDGGSAFPVQSATDPRGETVWPQSGMSLRDYFAGQALSGMCGGTPGAHLVPPNAASLSYDYADAMIAARSKP